MSEYKFSPKAYAKMIFHAAKYPHLAVNGILLAEKSQKGSPAQIVDAIPLFHQCLYLTPMTEIALIQVGTMRFSVNIKISINNIQPQIDALAEAENLVIAGYYAASENFYDCSIEKAPAAKIADKIQENYKNACFAVIENKFLCLNQQKPALKVFSCSVDGGRWSKATYSLNQTATTLESVSALLKRGAMKDIVDFDNHLDNPENDWTNQFLNRDLQQIMAMYQILMLLISFRKIVNQQKVQQTKLLGIIRKLD